MLSLGLKFEGHMTIFVLRVSKMSLGAHLPEYRGTVTQLSMIPHKKSLMTSMKNFTDLLQCATLHMGHDTMNLESCDVIFCMAPHRKDFVYK